MIPEAKYNIYPKIAENVQALVSHYFDKYDLDQTNAVEQILAKTSLSLNQTEYIISNLAKAFIPIFKPESINSVANLFRYGVDAFTKDESEWSFGPYSKGRLIIKKLLDFINEKA